MKLLGLEFNLFDFKKTKTSNRRSFVRKNLGPIQLIERFYHVRSTKELAKALKDDFIASFFLWSGSGLFRSLFKGLYLSFFINAKPPMVVGRFFKIINHSKIKIGRVFWAKDGVSLFAGGPLVIGNSAVLAERSSIWSGKEGVKIGNNFFLGIGSYISAIRGRVEIGNDVMLADHVRIYTWNHRFDKKKKPFADRSGVVEKIKLGNNCWLGTGSIVLPGVDLGNNCVVAAGTVLTGKKYPTNSVIAGVPGKVVKKIK